MQENNNLRNKRSLLSEESNHDLEDLIDDELDDSSEHWLARSVNRIKRSLGLSDDESKDLNAKHKSKRKNESEVAGGGHHVVSHHEGDADEKPRKLSKNKRKHFKNGRKRSVASRVTHKVER